MQSKLLSLIRVSWAVWCRIRLNLWVTLPHRTVVDRMLDWWQRLQPSWWLRRHHFVNRLAHNDLLSLLHLFWLFWLYVHDVIPHLIKRVEFPQIFLIVRWTTQVEVGCLEQIVIHFINGVHSLIEFNVVTLLEKICRLILLHRNLLLFSIIKNSHKIEFMKSFLNHW